MKNNIMFEQLENREMLDGNILVVLSHGVLTLQGDNASNIVSVKVAGSNVVVEPDDYTNIGSGPGVSKIYHGIIKSIRANLGNGDNVISISGDTSTGNTLSMNGDISIKAGRGNDMVDVMGVKCHNLNVSLGNGYNSILLHSMDWGTKDIRPVISGNFNYTGGVGDNEVLFSGVKVGGNVIINLGDSQPSIGDEQVSAVQFQPSSLSNEIGGNLKITGGKGSESIIFDNLHDQSKMGTTVGKNVVIDLKGGTDDVLVGDKANLSVGGSLTVEGKGGTKYVNTGKAIVKKNSHIILNAQIVDALNFPNLDEGV